MALKFTSYDLATGRIGASWEVPDMDVAMLNIDPATEGTIEGHVDGTRYYRRPDGTLAEYPPQPSPAHVWDYAAEAWIDPRTPEDIDALAVAELERLRSEAILPKEDFLWAVRQAGVLSPGEAAEAARGIVPASFEAALADMPAEDLEYLTLMWPAVRNIERMHAFLAPVAAAKGIGDEGLDAIFGIPSLELLRARIAGGDIDPPEGDGEPLTPVPSPEEPLP